MSVRSRLVLSLTSKRASEARKRDEMSFPPSLRLVLLRAQRDEMRQLSSTRTAVDKCYSAGSTRRRDDRPAGQGAARHLPLAQPVVFFSRLLSRTTISK